MDRYHKSNDQCSESYPCPCLQRVSLSSCRLGFSSSSITQTRTKCPVEFDCAARRGALEDVRATPQITGYPVGVPCTFERAVWKNMATGFPQAVWCKLHCRLYCHALVWDKLDAVHRIPTRLSHHLPTPALDHRVGMSGRYIIKASHSGGG